MASQTRTERSAGEEQRMVLDPAKESREEELPLVDGFGDDLEHVGRDEDFERLERLWQVDVEVGRGRRRRARSGRHCCDESMVWG